MRKEWISLMDKNVAGQTCGKYAKFELGHMVITELLKVFNLG